MDHQSTTKSPDAESTHGAVGLSNVQNSVPQFPYGRIWRDASKVDADETLPRGLQVVRRMRIVCWEWG